MKGLVLLQPLTHEGDDDLSSPLVESVIIATHA